MRQVINIKKRDKLNIVIPLLIAVSTFMLFRAWPFFERDWLIEGLIFVFSIYTVKNFYKTNSFLLLLLYFIVLSLNVIGGDRQYNSMVTAILELFKYSIPAAFAFCFISKKNVEGMRNTVIVFYTLIVYTALISFIINLSNPGVIRLMVGFINGKLDISRFVPLLRMGMSNYYLPHALPVLIPAVFLGVANKSFSKIIRLGLALVWISIIVLTFLSGATTALLFSIIFSVIVFLIKKGPLGNNIVRLCFILVVVIPLLINENILTDALISVEEVLVGTDYSVKVGTLEDFLESGQASGDIEARSDLYSATWLQLIQNPLFGTDLPVGGHSALLDRFACLGLIGFVPYMLFFYCQIKYVLNNIDKNYWIYYLMSVFIAILMLSMKYMSYYEMFMIQLAILPMSIIVLGGKDVLVKRINY